MSHRLTIAKLTFCRRIFGIVAALCVLTTPALAQERQYKVEAAFLYSFFNYITWPGYDTPQALKDPVICIYGDDPLVPYLKYVSNKVSAERNLTLRTVSRNSTDGCHLLFMRHRLPDISGVDSKTLTVFMPDDPLDRGGLIELTQEEQRIAVKIDQSNMERRGFLISSRLLQLAKRVR